MDGHTALLMMRAKRLRDEAETAAPYKADVDRAREAANGERRAREGLERIMRSKLLPHILEDIGHKISLALHDEIMKAVCEQKDFSGMTTLSLPTGMLLAADQTSTVARVVDRWRNTVAPKMSFAAGTEISSRGMTVLDIRLPEMGYREAVYDQI